MMCVCVCVYNYMDQKNWLKKRADQLQMQHLNLIDFN